jgi:hypothetical protein
MSKPYRIENLSPSEKAKLERRIRRYIQQGMCLHEMHKLGIKEKQATDVAAALGLEIKKGVGRRKI